MSIDDTIHRFFQHQNTVIKLNDDWQTGSAGTRENNGRAGMLEAEQLPMGIALRRVDTGRTDTRQGIARTFHPRETAEAMRQQKLCHIFAQLCTALEIAGQKKDPQQIITAENAIREFYAHCSTEDRDLLATFLKDMETGSRIVDDQRVRFHDRLGAAAALPLRFAEAFIRTSVPITISISKQAAALAVGTLRAVYKGARAGWQALN